MNEEKSNMELYYKGKTFEEIKMSEKQKNYSKISSIAIVKYNDEVDASGKKIFGDLIGKILVDSYDDYMYRFYKVSYIRNGYIGAVEIYIIDGGDNHSFTASVSDKAIALKNLGKYEILTLEQAKKEIIAPLRKEILDFIKEMSTD